MMTAADILVATTDVGRWILWCWLGQALGLQGQAPTCTEDDCWLILIIYVVGVWLVRLAIRQDSFPSFGFEKRASFWVKEKEG